MTDEAVRLELKTKMQKARNANKKANETLQDVYLMIKHMGVNLEKDINLKDVNNLEQAISCYIQGDSDKINLNVLLDKIMNQY